MKVGVLVCIVQDKIGNLRVLSGSPSFSPLLFGSVMSDMVFTLHERKDSIEIF